MNFDDLFIESKLTKPLTKDELYSYLEKFKKGDLEAREYVITHNIRLVIHQVCKRFENTPYEKKELVSIGLVGLVKSVDTFDISKHYEFATYATRCIDNEILMFIRKGKKYIFDQSIYTPIGTDKEGNEKKIEDVLEDITSDFASDYEDTDVYNEIRKIIYDLPDRDREIILLYFGFINNKSYTQDEISQKLNLSQSYISRLIKKIVKKIGLQLKEKGLVEGVGRIGRNSITAKQSSSNDNELRKDKEINMAKKLRTLYEYFNGYSKEQINEMISKLTDEEKNLIELRYGNDLENPVTSESWGKEEKDKFYGSLFPKMKKLLANPEGKRKKYVRKSKKVEDSTKTFNDTNNKLDAIDGEVQVTHTVEESTSFKTLKEEQPLSSSPGKPIIQNDNFEKEDYIRILQSMKTPTFADMLNVLEPKEAVIISLKLGYVDGKYFSTESIAGFLGIEQEEVREITKKILMVYKENINQFIDKAIDVATDQSLILKRKDN